MIRLAIWILIGILALSFFGISIQGIVESPTGQQNFFYFFHIVGEGIEYLVDFVRHIINSLLFFFGQPPLPR